MEFKEKAIKDVRDFMDGGDPKIHGMKFIMWLTKSEENLMKLSHYSHEEYKSVIPILVDVVISDFKKHYNVIPKSSDEYKRFVFKRSEMFDKDKRFNVHLTIADFDLLMDALDVEYRKYIGNERIERLRENKFYSECGMDFQRKTNNNSIDKTVNSIDDNINRISNKTRETLKSIKNELNESKYVGKAFSKFLYILGIIGVIILTLTLLGELSIVFLDLDERTIVRESWSKCRRNIICFLTRISPAIIFPLVLTVIGGIKKRWILEVGIILTIMSLAIWA